MKNQISNFIFDKLELPTELLSNAPNVQIVGDYTMNIEGCIGIKKYETNEIILRCKSYLIHVCGNELSMLTFTQGRICIRGQLSRYEIERV